MSADKRWKLVCYDVRDPGRYRKVFRVVRGVGRPLQYSVFRCRLDAREVERLHWELVKVMAPEDRLLIVDLCPTCAGRVVSRNQAEDWTVEPPTFTIVGPVADQAPADVGAAGPRKSAKSSK